MCGAEVGKKKFFQGSRPVGFGEQNCNYSYLFQTFLLMMFERICFSISSVLPFDDCPTSLHLTA